MAYVFTPEHRLKLSGAAKRRRHTPETLAKMSASRTGVAVKKCVPGCGCGRHTKSPRTQEVRDKISRAKKGVPQQTPQTAEQREKNRQAQLGNQRARGARHTPEMRARRAELTRQMWLAGTFDDKGIPTRGKPGVHRGVQMRCLNSEGVFARELDSVEIEWLYEPKRFKLSWCTYLPDFYLPEFDIWVEVKGYMSPEAQQKINTFRRETSKTLIVVFCSELPYRFYQDGEQD